MSRRRRRRRCRQPPIVHWRSQKLSSPNYATSLYNSNITSKTVSFFPFLKNLNLKTIIFKNAKLYLFFYLKIAEINKTTKKANYRLNQASGHLRRRVPKTIRIVFCLLARCDKTKELTEQTRNILFNFIMLLVDFAYVNALSMGYAMEAR